VTITAAATQPSWPEAFGFAAEAAAAISGEVGTDARAEAEGVDPVGFGTRGAPAAEAAEGDADVFVAGFVAGFGLGFDATAERGVAPG